MKNRRPAILLVHGWASSALLWDAVVRELETDAVQIDRVDLGYFGPPSIPESDRTWDVAVGHSAGTPWLIGHRPGQYRALLSICGFTRFVRGDEFNAGWPARVLQRMERAFQTRPQEVVADFLGRAAGPNSGDGGRLLDMSKMNVPALAEGLQALSSTDCRSKWSTFPGPFRALAADQDPIVEPALTAASFTPESIEWFPSTSHWLPITHAKSCASIIRGLIEAVRPGAIPGNGP